MTRSAGSIAVACLAASLCAALPGCGQSERTPVYDGPRFISAEEHYSIRALPGWRQTRERGSVVFVNEDASLRRHTIAIRVVPVSVDVAADGVAEVFLPATEKALAGLPQAKVAPPEELGRADFREVSYDLSFVPAGQRRRYARRHVVLIGGGGDYVFHLWHTAPDGELAATGDVFEAVLQSFQEEG